MLSYNHTPVMLDEAIQALAVQAGGRYIDCTLGSGGHAIAIMDNSSPGGQLLGIDADLEARGIVKVRHGSGTYVKAKPGPAISKSLTLLLKLEEASLLDLVCRASGARTGLSSSSSPVCHF